jgi:phosphoglycerate kinase
MLTRKRNVLDVLENLNSTTWESAPSILVRVDFNVPMNQGRIADDSRIRGAIPTIQAIVESKCNAILVSHMGRPKRIQRGEDIDGSERSKLTLCPVAKHLAEIMNREILFSEDCLGDTAKSVISLLPSQGGGIVLLENLRFYKGEEKNDEGFAQTLASYADAYINDAFGTCHRAHASTVGVPSLMDSRFCGIGILVSSELKYLDFTNLAEGSCVAAIIGGSKVSTKLPVIRGVLKQVDILILGGGLAFTFLKAQGISVGDSLVEDSMLDTALELLEEAKREGKEIILPLDAVCATSFPQNPIKLEDTKTFDLNSCSGIDDGYMGLDVGFKTICSIQSSLAGVSEVLFNGKQYHMTHIRGPLVKANI